MPWQPSTTLPVVTIWAALAAYAVAELGRAHVVPGLGHRSVRGLEPSILGVDQLALRQQDNTRRRNGMVCLSSRTMAEIGYLRGAANHSAAKASS